MENFIFFLTILINGFVWVTSEEALLSRRVRQVTPPSICFPDPSNPPPQMPQCFCCICAGISPFCRGLGPITTRRPLTVRPTTVRFVARTTPRTPPPITVPCVDGNAK
ncbi:unnamed protein product, partial [Mesorhabditis belari]|uniref:Secreted protein n=1 Tax=Mesorhabditis belari TaxID=2138241 RepID=A0AAF3J4Y1_9BILA